MKPADEIRQAQAAGCAEGADLLAKIRATQVSRDVTERSFARLPIVRGPVYVPAAPRQGC